MKSLSALSGSCPDGRDNYYEWKDPKFSSGIAPPDLVIAINKKLGAAQQLPTNPTRDQMRGAISIVRSAMGGLTLNDSTVARQFTPDLVALLK
jgi:hypothetical protein